jgi:Leucine-rich repeat (LRR) protein
MNKCFITKLDGASGNSNLLRIGEMRVHFDKSANPTTSNRGKNIQFTKDSQLEIIGDAYFTDENLSTNLGKKITVTKDFPKSVYVSNADCDVCILDKYSLFLINDWTRNTTNDNGNFHFDLEGLKYSKSLSSLVVPRSKVSSDIANLKGLTALTRIDLSFSQVSGDIANLKSLTALSILNLSNSQVSGDIANLKSLTVLSILNLYNTNISGDIANLKGLTALTRIDLHNTQVSGDIANLKGLTALTYIAIDNPQVPLTGDIGQLSTLSNYTDIKFWHSKLTGDLATLSSKCKYASFVSDKGSVFTWSTRPSTAKIIAIEGNASLTNIDKMLQDQAQCQVGFTSSDAVFYKTISVKGNRTSASDDAVAALQQKGYTISIAKA